ncbi:hypothetical protein DEM27_31860 [Metarhizobium album]|uniref:Uncharacterized protein n=1 Tax=Metarhizobium album TaxID=2182425 RepID=A0A2U2DFZ6_9HYPH|nr:hypothetical protein [Rhizobium album]PWE52245.1 hypothetical protein DEM27_31860 [Rhizobium album]
MASPQFSRSIADQLGLKPSGKFDYEAISRLLQILENRFKPLELASRSSEQVAEDLRTFVLARVNDILLPAIQKVFTLTERGFLVARSSSLRTLGAGNILTFVLDDPVERELFTPAPFTALTRETTPDDYGIARTIAYDRDHGEYLCEVLSFEGSAGPHGDWVIGALAGSTAAGLAVLHQSAAARDAAVAAAGAAVPAAATATTKAAVAATKADEAAASAQTAAQIAAYFEQLEGIDLAEIATVIADAQAALEDVQDQIEAWLSGGVPAASVTESATRVFVTPAQRTEIGQLRTDLTAMDGNFNGGTF